MKIKKEYSLSNLNSFGAEMVAKKIIFINNQIDIGKLKKELRGEVVRIIGGGTNLILRENYFDGVILKNQDQEILFDEDEKIVQVGPSVELDDFVYENWKRGYYFYSALTMVPGELGGAVWGNAGAYGVEISDNLLWVEVLDLENFERIKIEKNELDFSYRESFFKKNGNRYLILKVAFKLVRKVNESSWEYFSIQKFLKENKEFQDKRDKDLRIVIQKIRTEKFGDWREYYTAGSVFKNLIIGKEKFLELKNRFPEIPFQETGGEYKVFTGYLLEKVFKWDELDYLKFNQKNFLVLYSNKKLSGEKIFNDIRLIQKKFFKEFEINLEIELVVIP